MLDLSRRLLATVLAVALAGPALANPPGGGGAGGRDRGGGLFDSERTIDRIPLTFADLQRAQVLYIMYITAYQIFMFETLNAVVQRTENRLPLARIPILGQLVRPEYERKDFAPDKQVGTYYQLGKSLVIDLRTAPQAAPAANADIDWDSLEARLAREARRPVEGQILIETRASATALPARTLSVFNQDSGYTVLLGGQAISEETRREAIPIISNLPLLGHMFRKGSVVQKESELLILVSPSIVERAWD